MRSILFAAILLFAWPAHADISGKVVGITDGDGLTIVSEDVAACAAYGKRPKRDPSPARPPCEINVRLADIDAPELGQPFGYRAKQALSWMVYGRGVIVTGEHPDRYGRTVGLVSVPWGPEIMWHDDQAHTWARSVSLMSATS
jgi:endonuclease YncB( thermonuclease family)